MNYAKRQGKLIKLLRSKSLDTLLVRKKQNIFYLTGVKGEDAILFFSGRQNFLITDSRYKEEYSRRIKNCQVKVVEEKDKYAYLEETSRKTRSRRIGFESNYFSYSEHSSLKKKMGKISLVPVSNIIESLRMIKDRYEIKLIKNACKDGCSIMNYAVKTVGPHLSEESIKNRVEQRIASKGIKRADFDIIVAAGKNASMPHASASRKKVKKGEMVIIDLGTMNYGYNSDLTRTVFLGRIDRKYLRIYNIVLDAQKKAIENIKPGLSAGHIDRISRQYISSKGLGRYFIHALGHGIGLETHERPSISRSSSILLEEDMIMTVEPGVYIPGWGGVRIEDVVLVTRDGCEILTKGCKKDYAGRI